jgi:hypothetical protein
LLGIADLIGGKWPAKARAAALALEETGDKADTKDLLSNGARIRAWRKMITAVPLPEPWTDTERLAARQIEALRDRSIDFLDGDFSLEAVHCGWGEIEVFGVHEGAAPVKRLDSYGLIPSLAWSGLGLTLTGIDHDHAQLTSWTGSVLRHPRVRRNQSGAVPWWRHPHFLRGPYRE